MAHTKRPRPRPDRRNTAPRANLRAPHDLHRVPIRSLHPYPVTGPDRLPSPRLDGPEHVLAQRPDMQAGAAPLDLQRLHRLARESPPERQRRHRLGHVRRFLDTGQVLEPRRLPLNLRQPLARVWRLAGVKVPRPHAASSANIAALTRLRATSPCVLWNTSACMGRADLQPPFVAYASRAASVPKLSTVTPAYSLRLSWCTCPVSQCLCSVSPQSLARSQAMTPGSLSGLQVCPWCTPNSTLPNR